MECRNCGCTLKQGAKFCHACGMPANKPIIRYEDYDSCRDIFSDSAYAPVQDYNPNQNYSERINSMIHGTSPANTTGADGMQQNFSFGFSEPVPPQPYYGEIVPEQNDDGESGEKQGKKSGRSFLNKPLKKIIIDMTAIFMGVVIIAATLLLAVNYISESSKADASSDTSEYYEMDIEKVTSDVERQIVFASKYPSVIDMTSDGFKCEGKRYVFSGKITEIERHETFTMVKLKCTDGDENFTITANFESSRVDDTDNLKNGQEACITGILDLQNSDGTCMVYLNYAECDS